LGVADTDPIFKLWSRPFPFEPHPRYEKSPLMMVEAQSGARVVEEEKSSS
jgi:hypothetical protein